MGISKKIGYVATSNDTSAWAQKVASSKIANIRQAYQRKIVTAEIKPNLTHKQN